jgi:alanyl-tRNA synthetase
VATDIIALSDGVDRIHQAGSGQKVIAVLNQSPFYPEKGGQEWDTGWIRSEQGVVKVEKVFSEFLIEGRVENGQITENDRVIAEIDRRRRHLIEIHHTTTHLLHRALHEVLGSQVKQAGSWVGEDGLRFDFTHFAAMSLEEIEEVEKIVNQKIFEDHPVIVSYSSLDEAQRAGVIALFEEKYQSLVRIVRINDYTAELCGGTHLRRSSEAGLFKIVTETGIGSGLRRVEAVAGPAALNYLQQFYRIGKEMKDVLGCDLHLCPQTLTNLLQENKQYKSVLEESIRKHARQTILDNLAAVGQDDFPIYLTHLFIDNPPEINFLKEIVDDLRNRINKGIVLLGIQKGDSISGVLAGINLPKNIDLNRLIRETTKKFGGGGGGKPTLAQFGGVPSTQWDIFVKEVKQCIDQI